MPLEEVERNAALRSFAKGKPYTFGKDELLDDVVYCQILGCLQRAGGLEEQDRNFIELLVRVKSYVAEEEAAQMKNVLKR